MKIKVLFFASARDIAGAKEMEWEEPEGVTVGQFKKSLVDRFPRMNGLARVLSLAVNTEYADDCTVLQAGDEVAIIPPVSGG